MLRGSLGAVHDGGKEGVTGTWIVHVSLNKNHPMSHWASFPKDNFRVTIFNNFKMAAAEHYNKHRTLLRAGTSVGDALLPQHRLQTHICTALRDRWWQWNLGRGVPICQMLQAGQKQWSHKNFQQASGFQVFHLHDMLKKPDCRVEDCTTPSLALIKFLFHSKSCTEEMSTRMSCNLDSWR